MMKTRWQYPFTLEGLNALGQNTLLAQLDIRFTAFTENSITAEMPVDHRTTQPYGLLHGGATAALAETLGSVASTLMLKDPLKQAAVGIELNINHLKTERQGVVTGTVTPVKTGKRLHVWQIRISNQNSELVSISRLTTMIIDQDLQNH